MAPIVSYGNLSVDYTYFDCIAIDRTVCENNNLIFVYILGGHGRFSLTQFKTGDMLWFDHTCDLSCYYQESLNIATNAEIIQQAEILCNDHYQSIQSKLCFLFWQKQKECVGLCAKFFLVRNLGFHCSKSGVIIVLEMKSCLSKFYKI